MRWIYEELGLDGFEKAKPYFEKYIEKHKNYKHHGCLITDKIKEKIYKERKFAFEKLGYEK